MTFVYSYPLIIYTAFSGCLDHIGFCSAKVELICFRRFDWTECLKGCYACFGVKNFQDIVSIGRSCAGCTEGRRLALQAKTFEYSYSELWRRICQKICS